MKPQNSNMPERILQHIGQKGYQGERARRLAHSMGVEEQEYDSFRAAIKTLMKAGRIALSGGNTILLPTGTPRLVGTFRGHARGFGFVVPESPVEHGDVFIPPPDTNGAMTGDTVAVRITKRGKLGDPSLVEGKVVEILERGQNRFVGELVRQAGQWMMIPDGNILHEPILIADAGSSRAKAGSQIVVEMTQFPSGGLPGRGAIVEVLGVRGDPGIDTVSIMRQYNLPSELPAPVLAEARNVVANYQPDDELARREDLRSIPIITIDPADAKDYDDAISVRRLPGGQWELGVHIADVTALVPADGVIEREAAQRGNSVYFPGLVLPMIPPVLSNELCSLQEAQPRLTKSVFITYDRKGNRVSKRYSRSVIQSAKRLTYEQATDILESRTAGFDPTVVDLVQQMEKLAQIIRSRRLAEGMIVLDLPDSELVLNEDLQVTDVRPEDTSFSHTLIEMFMVEANEAVAELLSHLNVPYLSRAHAEPPDDAQTKLTTLLGVLGQRIPKKLDRWEMVRLLKSVQGKPESFMVNLAVLRSMARAEYSPKSIGHFALASKHYCHFTSPIRRYPDLTIHRLLDLYLDGKLKGRGDHRRAPSRDRVEEIGKHSTFTEQRAEAAERELKLVKILQLLEKRVGDREGGVVTAVTNAGLFVQLNRYLVDGLIRFNGLPDDWWDIDVRAGTLTGQRTKTRIKLGDPVQVQIAAVNLASRQLDLALLQAAGAAARTKTIARKARKPHPASRPRRAAPTKRRSRRR